MKTQTTKNKGQGSLASACSSITERQAPPIRRHQNWVLAGVLFIAITIFFAHVLRSNQHRPYTFDESVYARLGLKLKNAQAYSTQDIYQQAQARGQKLPKYLDREVFIHPPLFSWLISQVYVLLPQRSQYHFKELYRFASRVPIAMGSALIILVFFIGRRLFGQGVGALATILTAVDFNIFASSQKVWIATTVTFFSWLTLWFVLKLKDDRRWWLAVGVSFGLAMLAKYSAILIAVITIVYLLIYDVRAFRSRWFFVAFALAIAVNVPWIMMNVEAYGLKQAVLMMTLKQQGRIDILWRLALGILILPIVGWSVLWVLSTAFGKNWLNASRVKQYGLWLTALFMFYLLAQADVRQHLWQSWVWQGLPRNGWDLNFFGDEPWYFYWKQVLFYSPLYLLSLIMLVVGWRQNQHVHFLMLICFVVLSAGTIWQGFQGRYIIQMAPAAMLLAAKLSWDMLMWLWHSSELWRKALAGLWVVILIYGVLKTIHVAVALEWFSTTAYY